MSYDGVGFHGIVLLLKLFWIILFVKISFNPFTLKSGKSKIDAFSKITCKLGKTEKQMIGHTLGFCP